jgi:hypothetical protein
VIILILMIPFTLFDDAYDKRVRPITKYYGSPYK